MALESPNKMTSIRQLRKGLAIYKTGRSPFWMMRLRDPFEGRYVVRSTKEESRIEAMAAANEYADSFFKKANGDLALKKVTSFEYYGNQLLAGQSAKAKVHDSDRKLLYRQKDGIIRYFGDYDVSKITTRMIREYLVKLDQDRPTPLADSTRAKHVIVIRKVLSLAVEDGLMKTIPVMPKQKTTDTPRHTFTDDEYKRFMKAGAACVSRMDEVRGVQVTGHHLKMFKFVVHAFLRPTKGELFGLRHKDIRIALSPPHLEMTIHGGKTGKRTSVTMPICVPMYQGLLNPFDEAGPDKNAYVWMPEYPNRTTAINTARRIFNHILEKAELGDEQHKLSPYSLRHYALQARLRGSNGKVNIYTLAKNAGTSVDQLERFYLKNMAPTKAMIENLQHKEA
jgi:integrase